MKFLIRSVKRRELPRTSAFVSSVLGFFLLVAACQSVPPGGSGTVQERKPAASQSPSMVETPSPKAEPSLSAQPHEVSKSADSQPVLPEIPEPSLPQRGDRIGPPAIAHLPEAAAEPAAELSPPERAPDSAASSIPLPESSSEQRTGIEKPSASTSLNETAVSGIKKTQPQDAAAQTSPAADTVAAVQTAPAAKTPAEVQTSTAGRTAKAKEAPAAKEITPKGSSPLSTKGGPSQSETAQPGTASVGKEAQVPQAANTGAKPAGQSAKDAFSAAVDGEVGKLLRISLAGIGWIFLGDDASAGKIRYQGKNIIDGDTVFSFIALEKGGYSLKFQQQDLTTNTIKYDTVKLAIDSPSSAETRNLTPSQVSSPASPGTLLETVPPASSAAVQEEALNKDAPGSASGLEKLPGETDEDRYRRLIDTGRLKDVVEEFEKFVEKTPILSNRDEWYYKLGLLFESDPAVKNVKKALQYYEKVRDGYPLSEYWDDADKRGRYIRRNFFDIR